MLRNGVCTDPYKPLFPKGDRCVRARGLWVVRQQRGIMSNHMMKNIILLNVSFQNFECYQGGMLCDASHLMWNNHPVPAVGCRAAAPGAQLVLFPQAPSWSHTSFLQPQDLCTLYSLSARCALPRVPCGSLFHFLLTKI